MASATSELVIDETDFAEFETREMRDLKMRAAAHHRAEEFSERNRCIRQYDRLAFARWRDGYRPRGARRLQ